MRYAIQNDRGAIKHADSIAGAMAHACIMIYVGDRAMQHATEELRQQGKTTITYGFKTVTIEETTA
jgi:hypothetical protein